MVYISDLMEEATEIMLENQEKSENTRIFGEDKLGNAEAVGISAWIINDRKQETSKDYKFSSFWGYRGEVSIHTFQDHIFGRGCCS